MSPKRQQAPSLPPTMELDPDPPVYGPGHPWHGLELQPAYVRRRDEDGTMRWVYRPHVEGAEIHSPKGSPGAASTKSAVVESLIARERERMQATPAELLAAKPDGTP